MERTQRVHLQLGLKAAWPVISTGWLTISWPEHAFFPSGYLSKHSMNKHAQCLPAAEMPIGWQEQKLPGIMPEREWLCLVEQRETDRLKPKPLRCDISTTSIDPQTLWEPFHLTSKQIPLQTGGTAQRKNRVRLSKCFLWLESGWHGSSAGVRQARCSGFTSITVI